MFTFMANSFLLYYVKEGRQLELSIGFGICGNGMGVGKYVVVILRGYID